MKLAIINQTRIAAAFFTNALANNPIWNMVMMMKIFWMNRIYLS